MGRKRIDPHEKRKRLTITLPSTLIFRIKKENVNISKLVEEFLEKYLDNK